MEVNRRQFVILSCAAAAAGCGMENPPVRFKSVSIDAGPVTDYASDGVYKQFRDSGFFVIRRGEKLTVLTSTCTHRGCTVKSKPDQSFACPCHGSRFDPDGKVLEGPAVYPLPELQSTVVNGRLMVLSLTV